LPITGSDAALSSATTPSSCAHLDLLKRTLPNLPRGNTGWIERLGKCGPTVRVKITDTIPQSHSPGGLDEDADEAAVATKSRRNHPKNRPSKALKAV